MRRKKTISLPPEDEFFIEAAREEILQASGLPVITDSHVFRVGLHAILLRSCTKKS